MTSHVPANLERLQQRLGPDAAERLAAAAGEGYTQPSVDKGFELQQVAGLQAGGSVALRAGSYRFGQRNGSNALGEGQPAAGHFGITVSPQTEATLITGQNSVQLDGIDLGAATPITTGQIITVEGARFELASRTPSLRNRSGQATEVTAPMPSPSKGRGVDEAIVSWGNEDRRRAGARRRQASVSPPEINRRTKQGPTAFYLDGPDAPGFGRVPIALIDAPHEFAGDLSALNGATKKELQRLAVLPSVPLEIDLLTESIAIEGPPAAARCVASWLALAVAVTTRPDAVGIQVQARGHRSDWSWIDALPHPEHQPSSPLNVVVIDEGQLPASVPSRGAIVIVEAQRRVPDGVGVTMRLDAAGTRITRGGSMLETATPIGVSPMFALEMTFQINDHFHSTGVEQ